MMNIGGTERKLKNGYVVKTTARSTSRETSMKSTIASTQASRFESDKSIKLTENAYQSTYTSSQKKFNELSYVDPTEEMNKRWLKVIQKRIPTVDLVDISAEVFPFNPYKRQFAPEYSHSAFITMLR